MHFFSYLLVGFNLFVLLKIGESASAAPKIRPRKVVLEDPTRPTVSPGQIQDLILDKIKDLSAGKTAEGSLVLKNFKLKENVLKRVDVNRLYILRKDKDGITGAYVKLPVKCRKLDLDSLVKAVDELKSLPETKEGKSKKRLLIDFVGFSSVGAFADNYVVFSLNKEDAEKLLNSIIKMKEEKYVSGNELVFPILYASGSELHASLFNKEVRCIGDELITDTITTDKHTAPPALRKLINRLTKKMEPEVSTIMQ